MSDRRFEYHPEAIHEAIESYEWYAERSPQAAERFWQQLKAARIAATEHPQRWPQFLAGTRRCPLRTFPFGLVYAIRDDLIIGVAVAHSKRRPGYWQDRLVHQPGHC